MPRTSTLVDRTERGLHLVQLIRRRAQGDVEILVLYPADGYWRVKPLPPPSLAETAYGSSFLFGPIEEGTRPYVAIRSIAFEPATMTFNLIFRNGARGTLTVSAATAERTTLALAIVPAVAANRPFAALRSCSSRRNRRTPRSQSGRTAARCRYSTSAAWKRRAPALDALSNRGTI